MKTSFWNACLATLLEMYTLNRGGIKMYELGYFYHTFNSIVFQNCRVVIVNFPIFSKYFYCNVCNRLNRSPWFKLISYAYMFLYTIAEGIL